MNAAVVYQVVKALPKEEQLLLFDKMKKDFEIKYNSNGLKKEKIFSKEDAIKYLVKNVFGGNRKHL